MTPPLPCEAPMSEASVNADLLAALQRCQRALAILLDPKNKGGGPDMLGWVYCCTAETQARAAIARATGGAA
jgi:hypothetical protein